MAYIGSPAAPTIATVSDDTITSAKIDSTSTGMTFADLTVDTNTLVVDETNNRVGIGTSSPVTTLDVGGTIYSSGIFRSTYSSSAATPSIQPGNDANTGLFHPASDTIGFSTVGTERMRIDSSGRVTMPYQPAFFAYGNITQSWSGTSAYQVLQLGVQKTLGSRSTGYNTSTYTFTAPIAGTYAFFARITQTTTVTGPAMRLVVNSVNQSPEITIGYSTSYMTNGSFIMQQLAANDQVQVAVINYNNTSVTLDLTRTSFAGWLLG